MSHLFLFKGIISDINRQSYQISDGIAHLHVIYIIQQMYIEIIEYADGSTIFISLFALSETKGML